MIVTAADYGKLVTVSKLLVPPFGTLKVIEMGGSIPHLKHVNVSRILFPSPGTLLAVRVIHTDNRTASFRFVFDTQKVLVALAGVIILLINYVFNAPHIAVTAFFRQLCTVYEGQTVNFGQILAVNVMVGNYKEIELALFSLGNKLLKGQTAVGGNSVRVGDTDVPFYPL